MPDHESAIMSEPWLRIYPAEMRSDPKIAMLTLQEQALLPHAWDIAKNDSPTLGELRAVDGSPLQAKMFAALIPHATPALARRFYVDVVTAGLAVKADDGALCFPKLVTRQGIGNAVRQARFRDKQTESSKRNGERNAESNGDVTPRSQKSEVKKPSTQRSVSDVVHAQGVTDADHHETDQTPADTPGGVVGAVFRLLDGCSDADERSRRVLLGLVSRGATEADVADALGQVREKQPRKPAAYAVRMIQNALHDRGVDLAAAAPA